MCYIHKKLDYYDYITSSTHECEETAGEQVGEEEEAADLSELGIIAEEYAAACGLSGDNVPQGHCSI